MRDLAQLALDTAVARGAQYAYVRFLETSREDLQVKNGQVGGVDLSESVGIGVRVLVRGGWGYASTDTLTREGVEACAALAIQIARASSARIMEPVRLAPEAPHQATWASSCAIDPFSIAIER